MRIVAIVETELQEYVTDVFFRNSESGVELIHCLILDPEQTNINTLLQDSEHIEYDSVLIAIQDIYCLSKLIRLLQHNEKNSIYIVRLFALETRMNFIDKKGFNVACTNEICKIPNIIQTNQKFQNQISQINYYKSSLIQSAQRISYLAEMEIELSRALETERLATKKFQNKCDQINRKLQDTDRNFRKLRKKYNDTLHSLSFRLGRALTWLPRKIWEIRNITPFKILRQFKNDIMNGYRHYSQMMQKYGSDAQIYKTCGGTGDVYLAGLYFKDYLKNRAVLGTPVFTVIHKGGYDVAELFQIENIEMISYSDRRTMVHMGIFIGFKNINFTVIHHHPSSLYTSISASLETIHDMDSIDMLKKVIYTGVEPTGIPAFENNIQYIADVFYSNNLQIGKTVILAPYTVSLQPIPCKFWEALADILVRHGYTVCTNSKGEDEPPIKGTKKLNIPIKNLVPFLNMAGVIIGVRSGIIDVTETANIKRIIFYTKIRRMKRGEAGKKQEFIDHFPFNKSFKRNDAIEIEYCEEKEEQYLKEILTHLQNTRMEIGKNEEVHKENH